MKEQKVIETRDGWMIRCAACQWHEFPKEPLRSNGHKWTFNGDLFEPTFSPSMNIHFNPPGPHHNPHCKTSRCHFTVTGGVISYHGDCTHELRGDHPLLAWPADRVEYYAELKANGAW